MMLLARMALGVVMAMLWSWGTMASGVVFASTLLLDRLDRREFKVPARSMAHRTPQAFNAQAP